MRNHGIRGGSLVLLFVLTGLGAGAAMADPSPGLGFYIGPVASSDPQVYGNSSGIALGVDAQFVYNSNWTLSPYISTTDEISGTNNTGNSRVHVTELTGGLQARYWAGQIFFGGQYLFHSTLLSAGGRTYSGNVGPSLGLVAGWEASNHWSLVLQADALEGTGLSWFTAGAANRHDLRLYVGYHWY